VTAAEEARHSDSVGMAVAAGPPSSSSSFFSLWSRSVARHARERGDCASGERKKCVGFGKRGKARKRKGKPSHFQEIFSEIRRLGISVSSQAKFLILNSYVETMAVGRYSNLNFYTFLREL